MAGRPSATRSAKPVGSGPGASAELLNGVTKAPPMLPPQGPERSPSALPQLTPRVAATPGLPHSVPPAAPRIHTPSQHQKVRKSRYSVRILGQMLLVENQHLVEHLTAKC